MTKPKDIDEYITGYSTEIQQLLELVRVTMKKAVPQAEEVISYGMPALKLNDSLVWFSAWTNYISIYPIVSADDDFNKELSNYKGTKGSVHFPYDKPLPLELITKIATIRLNGD